MLNISIKTIKDKSQRYDTVGDYYTENGTKKILVSDLKDNNMEFLVAVHELVESFLCTQRGITDDQIDEFDFQYENNRKQSDKLTEPGDDESAPYYDEHQVATKIEKILADELGVDWSEYSKKCSDLTQN